MSMAKYNVYKGKRKLETMDFSSAEVKHLRKSGYAKKKGIKLIKKR